MPHQNSVHLIRFTWLLLAPLLAACSSEGSCFPDSKGKEYRIKVVELWDGSSQYPNGSPSHFPCPVDFDLLPGGSFTLRIDSFSHSTETCGCGRGTIVEAPSGWTWEPTGVVQECTGHFFSMRLSAKQDPCKGEVRLAINASQVPTSAAVPGQSPPASIQRTFDAVPDACSIASTGCYDTYVAEIEQL